MNLKRKLSIILVVTIFALISITGMVLGKTSWTFGIGSVIADGVVWGLGNHDIQVDMTAYGKVPALCQNNGNKIAPGRNPIYVQVVGSGTWYTDENGKAEGRVVAPDPELADIDPSPSPKDAGCPSDAWNVIGLDTDRINWYAANITITDLVDGTRNENLDFTCDTFYDENGVAVDLECYEVP